MIDVAKYCYLPGALSGKVAIASDICPFRTNVKHLRKADEKKLQHNRCISHQVVVCLWAGSTVSIPPKIRRAGLLR